MISIIFCGGHSFQSVPNELCQPMLTQLFAQDHVVIGLLQIGFSNLNVAQHEFTKASVARSHHELSENGSSHGLQNTQSCEQSCVRISFCLPTHENAWKRRDKKAREFMLTLYVF